MLELTFRAATPDNFELKVSPQEKLSFGLGSHQAPVGVEINDTITLGNSGKKAVDFKVWVPESPKCNFKLRPETGTVNPVRFAVMFHL